MSGEKIARTVVGKVVGRWSDARDFLNHINVLYGNLNSLPLRHFSLESFYFLQGARLFELARPNVRAVTCPARCGGRIRRPAG